MSAASEINQAYIQTLIYFHIHKCILGCKIISAFINRFLVLMVMKISLNLMPGENLKSLKWGSGGVSLSGVLQYSS